MSAVATKARILLFAMLFVSIGLSEADAQKPSDDGLSVDESAPEESDSTTVRTVRDTVIIERPSVPVSMALHPVHPQSTFLGSPLRTPSASFTNLFLTGSPVGSYRSAIVIGPSALGTGSSGPTSVATLIDGSRPMSAGGTPFDPGFISTLRVADVTELRGIDAALYVDAFATKGISLIEPEYDVGGSYLRIGYTGASRGISRVALQYARNVGARSTVSAGFRRLVSDGYGANDGGSLLSGDLTFDHYIDQYSRLRAQAEVIERDRSENGGIAETGGERGPILNEEDRRRRVRVMYVRSDSVDPTSTSIRTGVVPQVTASLSYEHDGESVVRLDAPGGRSLEGDFFTFSGAATRRISRVLFLRSHAEASAANGRVDRLHGAATLGFEGQDLVLEGGAAVTRYGEGVVIAEGVTGIALLGALSGDLSGYAWRVDGRVYPAADDSSPFTNALIDSGATRRMVNSWVVDALVRTADSSSYFGVDLSVRRLTGGPSPGFGIDGFGIVRVGAGPVRLGGNIGVTSVGPVDQLHSAVAAHLSAGVPFALFNGALDLYAELAGEYRSRSGGYRYDGLNREWYSSGSDRADPRGLDPFLSGTVTARIGSAFFTFEFSNLLNTEYWTTRRRPETGFNLVFELNWVLID